MSSEETTTVQQETTVQEGNQVEQVTGNQYPPAEVAAVEPPDQVEQAARDDNPYSAENLADPDYVPTRRASCLVGHRDKWIPAYKRIRGIFAAASPRERLLLWTLETLQMCSGFTKLDLANDITARLNTDFSQLADDPDMTWLLGVCQTAELLSSHT